MTRLPVSEVPQQCLTDLRRVLSIQSHVVSGYVGNRAATFPLQLLGWDVDVVNTVQYSNHAGYRRFGGAKTDAAELRSILDGLEKNSLMRPSRLLTGYVPGASALEVAGELAAKLRKQHPDMIYLLDPVMGDEGRLYVDSDVVPVYRDQLLPLATIITPNWYEVELLTKTKLDTFEGLRSALRILHNEYHVPHVVISSMKPPTDRLPSRFRVERQSEDSTYSSESLLCLCSSIEPGEFDSQSPTSVFAIPMRKIKGYFSGVGDIFSALVLAHFNDPDSPVQASGPATALAQAVTKAVNTTHSILLATHRYSLTLPPDECTVSDEEIDNKDPTRRSLRMRGRELRIIQSRDVILQAESDPLGELVEWENFWQTPVTGNDII